MPSSLISHIGDINILEEHKTAFFCSNKCPADLVVKTYDWATAMRDSCKCIASGFHTKIEQDVFNFLIKGTQPIIKVPARGIYKNIPKEDQKLIDDGRLLYLFFFEDDIICQSKKTCFERNKRIAEISDEIFIAYAQPQGQLEKLVQYTLQLEKPIMSM